MQGDQAIRVQRMAFIDGRYHEVPAHVFRSSCGWQVRVERDQSLHLADSHYGGPLQSLKAAAQLAAQQHTQGQKHART